MSYCKPIVQPLDLTADVASCKPCASGRVTVAPGITVTTGMCLPVGGQRSVSFDVEVVTQRLEDLPSMPNAPIPIDAQVVLP